jgi:protein-disulfide isomerase
LDIRGTPTFVMNGEMMRGYLPLDQMRAAVAAVRG